MNCFIVVPYDAHMLYNISPVKLPPRLVIRDVSFIGFYENSMPTDHPAKHGWWTIQVEGWVSALCISVIA